MFYSLSQVRILMQGDGDRLAEFLEEGAAHLHQQGDNWENVHSEVHYTSTTMNMEGETRDALVERTHGDMLTAVDKANLVRKTASIARDAIGGLRTMGNGIVHTANEAIKAKYIVEDDYTVLPPPELKKNPVALAAAEVEAGKTTAWLVYQATNFAEAADSVAVKIAQTAGSVHAVDFKEDPPGLPGPPTPIPGIPSVDRDKFLEKLGAAELKAAASAAPAFLGGPVIGGISEGLALALAALGYEADVLLDGKA